MFSNRRDAALQLAEKLDSYRGTNCMVLGILRGGIETGCYIADYLEAQLVPLVVRKLGHPIDKEYALGAIAEDGTVYYNDEAHEGVSQEAIDETEDREQKEILKRIKLFRKGRSLPDLRDKTVIIVDDGIATGATILCAISMCRKQGAGPVVVAAPVSGLTTKKMLEREADDVVILETPLVFNAVSQVYESFHDLSDKETIAILERWEKKHHKTEI